MPLAELIELLHHELEIAEKNALGKSAEFNLSSVDLQATVEVTSSTAGNARIRLWVAEGGAEHSRTSGQHQVITLHLRPTRELNVNDMVSGSSGDLA